MTDVTEQYDRLASVAGDITLPPQFTIRLALDAKGCFLQIECERRDVITGEMGTGRGGKAYPSEHATDSELVNLIFGLYLRYVEHEARETFEWRGKRIYGPHISIDALWEVARRVDVRSAMHLEDAQ